MPLVLPVVLLGACASRAGAPASEPPASPLVASEAPSPPWQAARPALDAGDPDAGTPPVAIGVEEATGWPRERIARRLMPSQARLRRCMGPSGGKINVRIESESGHLRVRIEPGASLDPSARECVVEALSTIERDDTGANAALPPPSGFTSLISISW